MSSTLNATGAEGTAVGHAQRSAATVFAIRVLGAGLAYGSQVLLARLMGKDAYGVFATTWVWILILGHVALFGLLRSPSAASCRRTAFGASSPWPADSS